MTISPLHQEQDHLGELPAGTRLSWTEDEARACRERLAADDAEFHQRFPADQAAQALLARAAQAPAPRRRPTLVAMPWLAAAVLLVGVGLGPVFALLSNQQAEERTKGSVTRLTVFRQSAEGVTLLADGAPAHAGDRLQVGFAAPPRSWVLVFSADGAGVLTPHFPEDGTRAVQLATSGALVPETYVLDAAPRYERFYLVVADHPFDRDEAWKVLRDHPFENRPAPGLTAYLLTLTKETP